MTYQFSRWFSLYFSWLHLRRFPIAMRSNHSSRDSSPRFLRNRPSFQIHRKNRANPIYVHVSLLMGRMVTRLGVDY